MTPVTAVANGTASVVAAQAAAPQVRASLSPSRPQNFCLSLSPYVDATALASLSTTQLVSVITHLAHGTTKLLHNTLLSPRF